MENTVEVRILLHWSRKLIQKREAFFNARFRADNPHADFSLARPSVFITRTISAQPGTRIYAALIATKDEFGLGQLNGFELIRGAGQRNVHGRRADHAPRGFRSGRFRGLRKVFLPEARRSDPTLRSARVLESIGRG